MPKPTRSNPGRAKNKNLVYANVSMMDKYLPGMMSVIYGDVEPKHAIDLIEG